MSIFYILWEDPHFIWFLVAFILVQLLWGLLQFFAGVIGKTLSSWLEKFMEAFVWTVFPDPEKTGEQLGVWVLSCLGVKHK